MCSLIKTLFISWWKLTKPDESSCNPRRFSTKIVLFRSLCFLSAYSYCWFLIVRTESLWIKFYLGVLGIIILGYILPRDLRCFIALLRSRKI